MVRLAQLLERYHTAFAAKYDSRLRPGQRRAISAVRRCRTPAAGELLWGCGACAQQLRHPRSCGNRHCPQCQNHEATQWLERQQAKLLPVEYFMVTFTLPEQLRTLAWHHQRLVYTLLLTTATETLKTFGLNAKALGGELGMTSVLHTHTRRLDFHPHCHIIIPGGAVNRARREWRTTRGRYLFNAFALAKMFRARLLAALRTEGLTHPAAPEKWVAHCTHVGRGLPALQYLSRYLYRGVISERHIVREHDGQVTFRYTESQTGNTCYRTLPAEDFLWLVFQHVLPRGFRRVRDYGFLHGNAKRLRTLVQWVLQVITASAAPKPRPQPRCPHCRGAMHLIGLSAPALYSG